MSTPPSRSWPAKRCRALRAVPAILLLAAAATHAANEPPTGPPSARIRTEPLAPEPIRVELESLPAPFHSESVGKPPRVAPVPEEPVLQVPAGFRVNVYADGIERARWLALTPDGDVLCAASARHTVHLLRDADKDGAAEERHVFIDSSNGARQPFGMAFAGRHFYLGNTDAVLRYDYEPGDTRLAERPQTITRLPGRGYNEHWTRNLLVAPDGKHLFVSVGSESNVDAEKPPRASIVRMKLDGSEQRVFASGLRNPVGLALYPKSGELYATVNERDGLGDDLVPDYLTHVEDGAFYGWPYAYLAPHNLDPRRASAGVSEEPELAAKTRTPDLLFQAHSAALGLAFYDAASFPLRYRGGAFVAFRGSWNRSAGTGYKIVFAPFDEKGRPRGSYEDFVTGFLIDPSVPLTWGRPVGVLVLRDGALLFTDEANGRIYRVSYAAD